ncbi:MAG: hydrogenase maturation nickel metallochaperone HypA [Bacteroidales bacterium]|nr:hydrogenase maturation nickel metallochaperone HypA [Bacteroidales bacterium]
MHELSIVMGIIDIARNEIKKANLHKVETIEIEIGTLAGIEFEALDFAWNMAVNNTVLEKAERKINIIQATAKCISCGYIFNTKSVFDQCPKCNELFTEIITGRELRVKAITAI